MGNSHSHEQFKGNSRKLRKSIRRKCSKRESNNEKLPTDTQPLSPSAITTPALSRSSSDVTSRPTSMIGDVRGCVSKLLGKSSSFIDVSDINTAAVHRAPPRRSFSAPAGCLLVEEDRVALVNSSQDSSSKYCLPTNDHEQDRLTNTHYVLQHCFGGNFSAPVHDLLSRSPVARVSTISIPTTTTSCSTLVRDNSVMSSAVSSICSSAKNDSLSDTRVLDVACGTGIWVLEMATAYPHTQFYGIDAANIFPSCIKPPNTNFQQYDILSTGGFPYPDEYFDYVHMRLVYNCFSKSDLKYVMNEINRVLKPGGFVEIRDIDPIIKNPGPVTAEFFSGFSQHMYELNNVDIGWTSYICNVLGDEGEFTDLTHQKVSVGFGFDGPLADTFSSSIVDALESYKSFFMKAYNMTLKECDQKVKQIIHESESNCSYFNYHMGWGRKPLVMEKLITESPGATNADLMVLDDSSISLSLGMSLKDHSGIVFPPTKCISVSPNTAELMESVIMENVFDIAYLTQGFTE